MSKSSKVATSTSKNDVNIDDITYNYVVLSLSYKYSQWDSYSTRTREEAEAILQEKLSDKVIITIKKISDLI
tara:strand:+ start:223 stop:438 length:216 start_codon:yes stop_codon:yes gene_type:complete